jgi:hypothetical protein
LALALALAVWLPTLLASALLPPFEVLVEE